MTQSWRWKPAEFNPFLADIGRDLKRLDVIDDSLLPTWELFKSFRRPGTHTISINLVA